jgi:hypothetical protein
MGPRRPLLDPFFTLGLPCAGLDAAGKTTILYKLHIGEILSTVPTIGAFHIVDILSAIWGVGRGVPVLPTALCPFYLKLSYIKCKLPELVAGRRHIRTIALQPAGIDNPFLCLPCAGFK